MERYGSVIGVKPEKLEEYKKLHAAVWPGVLAKIKECNIRNYSIYYKDGMLFSYFEYIGDDYEKICEEWLPIRLPRNGGNLPIPCQQPVEDRAPGEWWAVMEEVFHVD